MAWENLHMHESMVRQKSRFIRLKEGDQKYKLFHSYMKVRFRKNNIVDLMSREVLVEDVECIKELTLKNFHDKF